MIWYFPNRSGDFRLIAVDATSCLLEVEKPTAAERTKVLGFLTQARERGWVESFEEPGEACIQFPLAAPMTEAGALLQQETLANAATWTVVRSADGTITLDDDSKLVERSMKVKGVGEVRVKALLEHFGGWGKAVLATARELEQVKGVSPGAAGELYKALRGLPLAAATAPKPRRGCPAPSPARRRASEVLRSFCSRTQWETFLREGFLDAIGNATGKLYRVFHRGRAAELGLPRSMMEVASSHYICAWDNSVPPEEETLMLKLAVEHREAWLRSVAIGHV